MKRWTLLVCLLLPLAGWAQVNTDLFDTGFHSSSAIGQLEEMSGQSISRPSYSSGSYSTSSGSSYSNSGTTGAEAIRNAKSKFKKPSSTARTPKYRPPRPSKAQKEYARKLKKWKIPPATPIQGSKGICAQAEEVECAVPENPGKCPALHPHQPLQTEGYPAPGGESCGYRCSQNGDS